MWPVPLRGARPSRLLLLLSLLLSSCAYVPMNPNYKGPPTRPEWFATYYDASASYQTYTQRTVHEHKKFIHRRLELVTASGPIVIDYYQRRKNSTDLIFVFPVLGGKNIVAEHFAEYYAARGFDTAIVNRWNEFKDPKKFHEIEEVFRQNVVRDRIAMDFFQKEFGKTTFGSFGISRGAINVAMTAGVDPRLKYNVMALGGTDIVSLFKHSDQRGVTKYLRKVRAAYGLTKNEVLDQLRKELFTEPKNTAQYLDARHTLLVLALFDHAVPFKYGERLRKQIGKPRTVYVMGGHYSAILYTQFKKVLLPWDYLCLFPRDYIETEALAFYRHQMRGKRAIWETAPYRVLQAPLSIIAGLAAN